MNKIQVRCGGVAIGGGAPVSIQSMTNTDTRDAEATARQVRRLTEAGCQIVRIAVPDREAARAFGRIRKQCPETPLVADIHFDYRLALEAIRMGADKVRINPGNIGGPAKTAEVAKAAAAAGIPLRIGVNSGSLEKDILRKHGGVTAEGLAESVLRNTALMESLGFENLVVSLKASDVAINYRAHKIFARQIPYPVHIGITESGTVRSGKIKSAVGIGALLLEGIGDTVRVSLTGDPEEEVRFAAEILAAAGLRKTGINLVSCPTCGRTRVDLEQIARKVEERLAPLAAERERRGLRPLTVAVMGCAVNGPGEAREADVAAACGNGKALLLLKGTVVETVPEESAAEALLALAARQE